MTKEEAKPQIKAENRVKHTLFGTWYHFFYERDQMLDESRMKVSGSDWAFWTDENDGVWDTGWSIYNQNQ